jgi:hypothetical protein
MSIRSRFASRAGRWLLAGLLAGAAGQALAQQAAPSPQAETGGDDDPIEPEAMATLMAAAEFLAHQERFHFVTEVAYDVRQDSGQLLEFGAQRSTWVHRPDKLQVETQVRDGNRAQFVFDGKTVTLLDQDENVYATAQRPGNIDAALDFTLDELETPVPLAEILYSHFPEHLRQRVRSAYTVGDETLNGVACDHVAVRGDEVDVQFWIATGPNPLLRRVVLTYKHAEGQPQFRADFVEWTLGAGTAAREPEPSFEFKPPAGAQPIPFLLHTREVAPGAKGKEGSR